MVMVGGAKANGGWLAGVLVAGALLSGCQASDTANTRIQGAGVGAAVGAGLGQILGGDSESTVIGAALGGVAGLALGDVVARRKAGYASREAMIATETDAAADQARALAGYNAELRDELRGLDQEVRVLASGTGAREDRLATRQDELAAARSELADAKQHLAAIEREIGVSRRLYAEAQHDGARTGADLAAWDAELVRLERQRDQLAAMVRDYEHRTAEVF